jgi:hypothetical protein
MAVIERSPKMPPTRYGEITAFLNVHGQPGEVVLNTHWPDFVQLVWHSPQFDYVSGLDGHYLMYGDDATQFELWFDLRDLNNFVGKDIGEAAVETFGARWIVMPAEHHTLAAFLQDSRYAKPVLATEDGWLFELRRRDSSREEDPFPSQHFGNRGAPNLIMGSSGPQMLPIVGFPADTLSRGRVGQEDYRCAGRSLLFPSRLP